MVTPYYDGVTPHYVTLCFIVIFVTRGLDPQADEPMKGAQDGVFACLSRSSGPSPTHACERELRSSGRASGGAVMRDPQSHQCR